jgi:hypothetical protein
MCYKKLVYLLKINNDIKILNNFICFLKIQSALQNYPFDTASIESLEDSITVLQVKIINGEKKTDFVYTYDYVSVYPVFTLTYCASELNSQQKVNTYLKEIEKIRIVLNCAD